MYESANKNILYIKLWQAIERLDLPKQSVDRNLQKGRRLYFKL